MRKLIVPAATMVLFALLVVPGFAQAKSKYADIRVVDNDGTVLAEHRQYTDDVKVKASSDADCFGSPSSDDRYKLNKPTVLGTLIDAASNDEDLRPVSITDAFFASLESFGVCAIGGVQADDAYWYSSINGVGASAGPNQIRVQNGDRHVWYFTPFNDEGSFPSELSIKAPKRVAPNETFTVKVTRQLADGSKEPAEGVNVIGGTGGTTDAAGETDISVPAGTTNLSAEGEADDIPPGSTLVCAQDDASDCPKRFGITIRGSAAPDEIRSTRGADNISCGRGRDVVTKAQRTDSIAKDCEKVKRK